MENSRWETLAAKANYSPGQLAALCGVSIRTLQRHFARQYQTTLGEWLRKYRIETAYNRIKAGETVKSVAYDLGFKQLSHFSRSFKRVYGVAPSYLSTEINTGELAVGIWAQIPGARAALGLPHWMTESPAAFPQAQSAVTILSPAGEQGLNAAPEFYPARA